MYRTDPAKLTVRACSTNHAYGGTLHNVIGGVYHELYNKDTFDYDVAVLRVCTDINTAIYIAMSAIYFAMSAIYVAMSAIYIAMPSIYIAMSVIYIAMSAIYIAKSVTYL